MDSVENVESDESSNIGIKNTEVISENNENNEDGRVSEDRMLPFLTASELFTIRENVFKNKSKDDDVYKGPKLYYPSNSATSEEIIEDVMQDNQKSLKLQRIAKNKDCLKAEWNEEQKVAIVPYLKGKTTQHMGITVNGKCVLSPVEALFLLEKGIIEVESNKMPLSIEEAYSLMLKGKLAVEKYEVYTHLSQQGFIVVHHQSRIGPNYLKIMNLSKKKKRKRKAEESTELPEQKRLTFSGVFPSLNSVNVGNMENNFSQDCLLSQDVVSSNDKYTPSDTVKTDENMANTDEKMDLDLSNHDIASSDFGGIDCHASLDREAISNNAIPSHFIGVDSPHTSLDKEANVSCFKEQAEQEDPVNISSKISESSDISSNISDKEENVSCFKEKAEQEDPVNISSKISESYDISSNMSVKDVQDKVDNAFEKKSEGVDNEIEINDVKEDENGFGIQNVNENVIDVEIANITEIDVENNKESVTNANEGDTNDVMIEEEEKSDINVEDSGSGYDDNEEYESTDESIPIVYEDSNEGSLDVYSCSPSDLQSDKDINIEANNLISKLSKDRDEEVTLVRVMKKEKKPLAVIDLLSDEEDNRSFENHKSGSNARKAQTETNGKEAFEDSDEEIQVLDEVSGTGNRESSLRNINLIKSESGRLKTESSNVKTQFKLQMKFPQTFKRDMICVSRPPLNLLPIRCQPAKEAYILTNEKSSQPRSIRVWNSYKDIQEYQRERQWLKERDYFDPRSSRMYPRYQNDALSNEPSPAYIPEHSRDSGIDRNHNYPDPTNRSFFPPNSERGLLPTPSSFSSPNRLPFSVNIHNFQNLSTSNPVAFVNEIQKTVYSVASNMISTILNQHLNPNNSHPTTSPMFNDSPHMNFNPRHNSFSVSPGMSSPMGYNSSFQNDFHPMRFPPHSSFSSERHSSTISHSPFSNMETNWRQSSNFRQRNFPPHRGPSFPCMYRDVRRKKDWNDVKTVVEGTCLSDSGSDIEEVPINLNRFLHSNDIKPLVDPGNKLSVADGLKSLKLTQVANLHNTKQNIDRYLPATPTLDISFDVYLPNTNYRRSEPSTPNYRIVVVRASDPLPRYSELVNLQRKWNDAAVLQVAVVDHGDISFYSFNNVNIQELVPFDSLHG